MFRADLTVQYNIFTNEVISDGVTVSFDRFDTLPLDPVAKTTFKFYEQGMVYLERPSFTVSNNYLQN